MDGVWDVVIRTLLAPISLWHWARDRRQARSDAERRVRMEVLAANRRIEAADDSTGRSRSGPGS